VETIRAVLQRMAGRCPVSAAFGEFIEDAAALHEVPSARLAYAKWGLAGCGRLARWQDRLADLGRKMRRSDLLCRPVAVAYADWQRAQAPPPAEVCAFAAAQRWGAFLIDTWGKDGTTLLDWLAPAEVFALCRRCRQAGVPVALAGSLGREQMEVLWPGQPAWFAVRGAVCRKGDRQAGISPSKVHRLAGWLAARAVRTNPQA
jgi:uncharacterized protein (UPF0264 family)